MMVHRMWLAAGAAAGAAGALVLSAQTQAELVELPAVQAAINGNEIPLTITTEPKGAGGAFFFSIGLNTESELLQPTDVTGEFLFTPTEDILRASQFNIQGDTDPVIVTAVGAVDTGAPSSFAISVAAPLVPTLSGKVKSTGTVVGGLTDGGDDGTVSMTVGGVVAQPLLLETSVNGTGVTDVGPGVAPTAVGVGGALAYGPFMAMSTFDCPVAGCTTFDLTLAWTGRGGGDGYAFTGTHLLVEVPAPVTLGMLGSGLLALGFAARRRVR